MDDLHIVTVVTESKYYFPYLVKSCQKYGKELEILGYGQKWKGFNWKFKLMIEYLETLNDNDIVCFIDGYDVICTRNLNELKTTFLTLYNENKCKIIVGYDNTSHTNFINKLFVKTYFGTCNGISLNSGTYIGFVKDLLQIIKQIRSLNDKDNADDQILMTKFCNLNDSIFYIDKNNEIFLALDHPLNEIDNIINISNGKNISYNDNFPFFLHGPGSTFLDNVIQKLGYCDHELGINQQIKYKYNFLHIFVNGYPKLFLSFLFVFITLVFFLVVVGRKRFFS